MDIPSYINRTTAYGGALVLLLLSIGLLFFAPDSGPAARFLEGAALWLLVGGAGLIAVGELLASRISRAGACVREDREEAARDALIAGHGVFRSTYETSMRNMAAQHEAMAGMFEDWRARAEVQGGVVADAPLVVAIDWGSPGGDWSTAVVRRGDVITDALVLPRDWRTVLADPLGNGVARWELVEVSATEPNGRRVGYLRERDGRWVGVDGETLLSDWLGNLPPRGPGGGKPGHESAVPGAEGAATPPESAQEARSDVSEGTVAGWPEPVRDIRASIATVPFPSRAERARLRDDAFARIRSEHWAETADRVLDESRPLLTDVQRALLEGARDRTLTREAVRARVERVANALLDHTHPGMAQLPPGAMEDQTTARAITAVGDMRIEAVQAARGLGELACELATELERVRGVAVNQLAMATSARRALSMEVIDVEGAAPDDPDSPRTLVYTTRGGDLREVPGGQLTGYSDGESGNYVPPQREELRVLGKAFVLDQLLALGWMKEAPSGYYWPIFDDEEPRT